MCVVSMIADDFTDRIGRQYPWIVTPTFPIDPPSEPSVPTGISINFHTVSRAEFDALKKEVEEMKKLLQQASKYDAATGQKGCEKPDKLKVLRAVADAIGMDISDLNLNE